MNHNVTFKFGIGQKVFIPDTQRTGIVRIRAPYGKWEPEYNVYIESEEGCLKRQWRAESELEEAL